MSHIRSKDTEPEILLRKQLWSHGFRYLKNDKRFPGKPDLVFPRYRSVIFVHGCFWHGHSGCDNFILPKSNIDYWKHKINSNIERDQKNWRALEALGWSVIIVWECQLAKHSLDQTIKSIESQLDANQNTFLHYVNQRREINSIKSSQDKEREGKQRLYLDELSGQNRRKKATK